MSGYLLFQPPLYSLEVESVLEPRDCVFSARLEASKLSNPLGTGVTSMHMKSSLLRGCWDSNPILRIV